MAKRPITADLLELTIESKMEAGVNASEINRLIYSFADEESARERDTEMVGYLGVEDIPHHDREAFLTALVALSAKQDHAVRAVRQSVHQRASGLSATELLRRAVAALRAAKLSAAP